MGFWLNRFLQTARRSSGAARRFPGVANETARTMGRGVLNTWDAANPIGKGAMLGAGAGAAYGMSNIGRPKYAHAKTVGTRVRRAVRGAGEGALAGAGMGWIYRAGLR